MNIFKNNKSANNTGKKAMFSKTNEQSLTPTGIRLTPEQQTKLIGRGNTILNEGDVQTAHKIFKALKFYDGLMRVSKAYYDKGQCTQAYIAACDAGAHRDVESLGKAIAGALRAWISPADKPQNTLIANQKNIQPPNPHNIAKILALAKANKNINY